MAAYTEPVTESIASKPDHAETANAVMSKLRTDVDGGLSQEEAGCRLLVDGENVLETAERSQWFQVLGRQFKDVLILILFLAAIVSLVVGELTDAATIFAIILLNGVLGFVQEWKAERALQALQQMLSPRCRVIRDGQESEIDASQLVVGDVVTLETGDRVPADLRLVSCMNLRLDESVLTGESVPVSKHADPVSEDATLAERKSMAWMGTAATGGRAVGVVTATGSRTEFGRIATLTEAIGRDVTPLQQKLGVLGRQLGFAAVVIAILVAATGLITGKPTLEMFLTGVSLAVAVVPEGLPAVVTLTLALGVREMVRRRALLRRLRAAEALGAATVICTDKTGTLTENQMTVQKIWLAAGEVDVTGVGYDPAGHFEVDGEKLDCRSRSDLIALLESGLHCNHAKLLRDENGWHQVGAPTECALVVGAYKASINPDDFQQPVAEYSFDSTRKRMSIVERSASGLVAHVKGAPEVILSRCTEILDGDQSRKMTDLDRDQVVAAYISMAESGLRTLAIARRGNIQEDSLCEEEVERNLVLLGIAGVLDPPRPEAAQAIRLAQTAGIRVFMITGDSPTTAMAIARRVGMSPDRSVIGSELEEMGDEDLNDALEGNVVFARTTPEHKLRIVNALQSRGHIVGMTGDGVNDAPALKKADIGIAMGKRGTDVAKGASDLVLTDDNFSSIIGAIEEGRRQYDNIQKFVRYLLSSNTGEVVAIFINILLGGPLIFLPVQILWMNLVTDGMTAVALGMEPAERSVMQRSPRDPNEPVLNGSGIAMILALGTYVGLVTLWLFHHYLSKGGPETLLVAQTVAFTGIVIVEKANVLNFRTLTSPLHSIGFFSNVWVLAAIGLTVGLQVAAVYVPILQRALHTVPLGWSDWGLIALFAAPIFVFTEFIKWMRIRFYCHSSETMPL